MSRPMLSIAIVLLVVFITGSVLLTPAQSAPAVSQASPIAEATPCPTTTEEQNKALVRRYWEEGWGQGHIEVLEEVLAEDYVYHLPGLAIIIPAEQSPGAARADVAERIQEYRTDFPDLRITVEEVVAEGDRVAVRTTWSGTQADPLEAWDSPDTGRYAARETWVFSRVACGKIAEGWSLPDNLSLLRQLGIITDEELADAGTPTVATPVP